MDHDSHPIAPAAASAPRHPVHTGEFHLAAEEVAFDTEYDPADYRWVPVRRRRRADGWTPERQRRFIEVLADTGVVSHAARAVNMTDQAAHALRRAPGAEGFATAWRAALDHAADLLASVAFERAIRGEERTIYDAQGHATGSRIVYNNRLLTFLLRAHRPDQYARDTERERAAAHRAQRDDECRPAVHAEELSPPPALTVEAALRAMEPQLPAPPEDVADFFETDIECADIMDGEVSGHWRDWADPREFDLSPEKHAELERLKQGPPAKVGKRRKRGSGLKLDESFAACVARAARRDQRPRPQS